jgi:hypothetical protein
MEKPERSAEEGKEEGFAKLLRNCQALVRETRDL